MRTKFLTKWGADRSAAKQTLSARGGGRSSGWSRIDYAVRKKTWRRIPYWETYVRTSDRSEYYRGN